MQKKER